jgi:hypothetical protein
MIRAREFGTAVGYGSASGQTAGNSRISAKHVPCTGSNSLFSLIYVGQTGGPAGTVRGIAFENVRDWGGILRGGGLIDSTSEGANQAY